MSHRARAAVYDSHLETPLRLLALTLADICPNDEGTEIWPGIPLLMTKLRSSARAVHRGLSALLARQVLARDGYHGRTRRYRFNFERLAAYRPPPPTVRTQLRQRRRTSGPATSATHGRRHPDDICHPRQTSEESTSATYGRSPVASTLSSVVGTSAAGGTVLCHSWQGTLPPASLDPLEQNEQEEPTGADAPAPFTLTSDDARSRPAFKVYAAIATVALNDAVAERDDSLSNITEGMKRRCAAQHIRYDADIVRKAIDAAMCARRRARDQFFETRPSNSGSRRQTCLIARSEKPSLSRQVRSCRND